MKKILVPVDFSEHSEYALEVAATIAKKYNAEITVLHMLGLSEAVLSREEASGLSEAVYYMKLAKQRFDSFLDKAYLKGIKIKELVQNYKVFSEINEAAMEQEIDLIVMGSHGTGGGINEIFIGSNAEKVVRTSKIPVLVIKQHISNLKLDNVVFACDFKPDSIKPYVNASTLFKKFGSKLHLLYINLPNESFKSTNEIEHRITEFLTRADGNTNALKDVVIRNDYTAESGIFKYGEKIGADLIAIPTHGRRGLAHFFYGSLGEDLVNHASIPVMTFRTS
ncbi:universal stress protein [Ascidiimonas sp. W6]|uniref:universal stress protein n=1 Tax=Ascidiimonas meishanensis TaxID=3128903 RepID=UPI0030EEA092